MPLTDEYFSICSFHINYSLLCQSYLGHYPYNSSIVKLGNRKKKIETKCDLGIIQITNNNEYV